MKGKRAAPTRRITEEVKRKCKQSGGGPNLFMLTIKAKSTLCAQV
jgi:hypothetical protein